MVEPKLEKVSLIIEDQVFEVTKDLLCEHSDYFRAMFSGNFSENEKQEIAIDVVDANSMQIIIKYMEMGLIDLSEFSIATIGEIAVSANFLQITELSKQIEYCLELQLAPTNWMEIMTIAHNVPFSKLEERTAAFGLYQFKLMKPEYIQSVHNLVWYLSHSHIHAESEIQVFKFGFDWVLHNESSADTMLLVIGSLDMSRLTKEELNKIRNLMEQFENSLAEKVIDCLYKLATDYEISEAEIKNNKSALCEKYTERVYNEVLNLVTDSSKRELQLTPCVGLWDRTVPDDLNVSPEKKARINSNSLYKYENQKLTQWLEVTNRELWGWSVVAWGPTKIVIVGGENGKGTGFFWKGLRVYDTIRKEWTDHGQGLPSRRHSGVTIIEDSLYIIGGVGGYRIVMDHAGIYDLKEHSYRNIEKFPDAIQSPAVCAFENQIYAAGHNTIYRYEDNGERDRWVKVLEPNLRLSRMVAYNGYIYCTQNYFNNFYRFRPNVDQKLELVKCFSNSPTAICHMGDKLIVFGSTNTTQEDTVTVEEYYEKDGVEKHQVLFSKNKCLFTINEVAGSCAIMDKLPPIKSKMSKYLKQCIAKYEACYFSPK